MEVVQGKTNIRQVAALAGVSHMTVSRVLNGHPNIRESTRERVLEAIEEMNYRPNGIARALATSRAMRIGVLVDSPSSTARTARCAPSRARRAPRATRSPRSRGRRRRASTRARLEHLVAQGVDALCVIAPRPSSLDRLREPRSPAFRRSSSRRSPTATDAHRRGRPAGRRSARSAHLIELGHRSIAHLAGPLDWFDAPGARRAGASAEAAGLPDAPTRRRRLDLGLGYEFGRRPIALPACHGRSSPPTTRWRSGSSTASRSAGCACPTTSASSASTTCPTRGTSCPR